MQSANGKMSQRIGFLEMRAWPHCFPFLCMYHCGKCELYVNANARRMAIGKQFDVTTVILTTAITPLERGRSVQYRIELLLHCNESPETIKPLRMA